MTRFFCIVFCLFVSSACVLAPPFRTTEEVFSEFYLDFDFVNSSEKTVKSLEVTIRTEGGEPLWICIPADIPPKGSTRIRVALENMDDPPDSFAITSITYTDGSEYIDLTGQASEAWW
ncbi:MAG TPA: hypothetical protein GXZ47_10315 [Treponema sp.]|nr:hypothetical protein [Treponema sp.]